MKENKPFYSLIKQDNNLSTFFNSGGMDKAVISSSLIKHRGSKPAVLPYLFGYKTGVSPL